MDKQEIIKNAVKYPFSGIKNVLILGIIIFTIFFVGLTSFFLNGYFLRIIRSSLDGESKPPKFNNWIQIFLDGLKVFVVTVGYSLPLFLIFIILVSTIVFFQYMFLNSTATVIQHLVYGSFSIAAIIAILYVIIIIPIFLMALVHMVYNGEFNSAFEVRGILNKIRSLGWKNFIKWYIITIIPALAITIGITFLGTIISNILQFQQLIFLISFILAPIFMYISRSATLFYMSGNNGYLICEDCGGYYKLQSGESPNDYEKCQCGGKLEYSTLKPFNNESENIIIDNSVKNHDNTTLLSIVNLKNKKFLIPVIFLILAIIAIPILIYSTQSSTSVLTQTPTNYTLLKSYNANILNGSGISVTIPKGTQKIKIVYDLSTLPGAQGNPDFYIDSYNIDINEIVSPPPQNNIIDDVGFLFGKEQNKTGTYNFNNPKIKSLSIEGNGIHGIIRIYTS